MKNRFPYASLNVIVTAIGGENSEQGAARFEKEVLCHRPDVLTIDYSLNDRDLGLARANTAWRHMIEAALKRNVKIILLTPTPDMTQLLSATPEESGPLRAHAEQVRGLASEYGLGLVDSLALFMEYAKQADLTDLLSWVNHPNRAGHEIVARAIVRYFPAAVEF